MNENTQKELKCTRYLTGEMGPEDRLVFEIELSLDEELLLLFENYKKIWSLYPIENTCYNVTKPPQNSLSDRIKTLRIGKVILSTAAILLVLIGCFFYYENSFLYTNQIIAAKNERVRVMLPDSSEVILNAESSIEYPITFGEVREVTLKGEAYFKVAKDADHPFIVHNNGFDVKVLGTSFCVNTRTDQKKISLKEGKVEVLLNENNDKITLYPMEQLLLDTSNNRVIKRNFNVENEFSWIDNLLILENLTFKEALSKINSFYGVHFVIEDPQIEHQRITGAFKDQKLEEFITSLEFITNVQVTFHKTSESYLIKSIQND